ncbi:MAG: hypothetical protein HY925_12080, partial [Elusimicrobia bacterium]|nr:hypothetical protein [Elusimicrobiota bacterium]
MDSNRKRSLLALAVLGGAVVLTALLALAGRRTGVEGGRRGLTRFLSPNAPRGSDASVDAGDEDRPGTSASMFQTGGIDEDMSFGTFISLIKNVPRGRRIGQAIDRILAKFSGDPKLNDIHQEFVRRSLDGEKATASDFLSKLRGEPSFNKLAQEFMASPGSVNYLASLGADPGLKTFLKSESAKALGGPLGRGARAGIKAMSAHGPSTVSAGRVSSMAGELGTAGGAGGVIKSQGAQSSAGTSGTSSEGKAGSIANSASGSASGGHSASGGSSASGREGHNTQGMAHLDDAINRQLRTLHDCCQYVFDVVAEAKIKELIRSNDIERYGV